ncbi:MAG: histidine kinase [Acidobacteriota bacterium]|nr:histidine kinase [Acidobacteriota bacterium]
MTRFALIWLMMPALPLWAQDSVRVQRVVYHKGDQRAWASPDFDDSDWKPLRPYLRKQETYRGALWIRAKITPGKRSDPRPRALRIVATANYQVFWDGRFLGGNGRVSAKSGYPPGRTETIIPVPDDLDTPETHLLALRISTHLGDGKLRLMEPRFDRLDRLIHDSRMALIPMSLLSSFLVVGLYFLFTGRVDSRQGALRLFGALCVMVGTLFFLEYWRLLGYPYHLHRPRTLIINALTMMVSVMLPLFFFTRYAVPGRMRWTALAVIPMIWAWFGHQDPDLRNAVFFVSGLSLSLAATLWAVWRRRPHAGFGLTGCLTAAAGVWFARDQFVELHFYTSFLCLMLLMLASTALQLRALRRRHEEARLNASRLENELLRRHLQPHFMMNSLTAVQEWMEEDPPTASRLIEALGQEMRTLARIADRTLIPLKEELALCRAHLTVMSYRKDWHLDLECSLAVENVQVPPALLHTLIENGITHAAGEPPGFELVNEQLEGDVCFTLTTLGTRPGGGQGQGTGLKYIRSRLEEAFPGRWSLEESPLENGWVTRIRFPLQEVSS